jgi:colicin import membrane protein
MDRALAADDLRPQRPGGLGRGALLAIAAHVGLIVALAIGVNWRASEPAGVSAELWAQVPQAAAPKVEAPTPEPKPEPKPEPPPPPPKRVVAEPTPPAPAPARDAEIALEAQKKKQAAEQRARELAEEKRKADAERRERERELAQAKKQKAEADERERIAEAKRQQAAEEAQAKRAEEQRKANLDRMMAQAGGTGAPSATGQAPRDAGPSASYAGRIIARIRPNIVLMDTVAGNPMAAVEVRAAPDGTIIGRRLLKPSGNAAWDQAVLRAIDRTEILPRDTDGRVPALMTIEFRPRD